MTNFLAHPIDNTILFPYNDKGKYFCAGRGGENGQNQQEHRTISQEGEDVTGRPCEADEGVKMHHIGLGTGKGKPTCKAVETVGEKIECHCFGFNLTQKGKNIVSKKWWARWEKSR